jgi:hypothetical protein
VKHISLPERQCGVSTAEIYLPITTFVPEIFLSEQPTIRQKDFSTCQNTYNKNCYSRCRYAQNVWNSCFCNLELNRAKPSLLLEFLFFISGRIAYPRNGTSLNVSILKRTLHGASVDLETYITRCGTDAVLVNRISTRWLHRVMIRMIRTLCTNIAVTWWSPAVEGGSL